MKGFRTVSILILFLIVLSAFAALSGILSDRGPGSFEHESIRGEVIEIYGKGVYQHMSAVLAVQGIAQDYVTLLIGIPFLIYGLILAGKGSYRGRYLLGGVLTYFLVTYLFYTMMCTYNQLFLVYVILTSLSFFALTITLISFQLERIPALFKEKTPVGLIGGFLIGQAVLIALLWLSIILPPLFDGSIVPREVSHYTTLVVQGFDLALLLPIAVVSGILIMRRRPYGYLLAPVFMIFLAFLMTALTGKVIGQMRVGVDVGPALVIIPLMNLIAIFLSVMILTSIPRARAY